MQTITRKTTFDSGHRVMNERMKCFNIHGHTYTAHLTFSFKSMEEIGYAIDFKEIKRVGVQWIQDMLDHGMILNPDDTELIKVTESVGSKMYLMSLNGQEYCNPTAENISKEIFLAMRALFLQYEGLEVHEIELWETPNCSVKCTKESISLKERDEWSRLRLESVLKYASMKGIVEYDDRKI